MKSLRIIFLSVSVFFIFSVTSKACRIVAVPDTGCDVITLTNGKLIYCKIKSIGPNKVKYTGCGTSKDSIHEIERLSVAMVNYPDGTYKTITLLPTDSLHKPTRNRTALFHCSINAGISLPTGHYGSSYYVIDADDPVYCGFASPGYTYNATIGVVLKEWELTVMGAYTHNDFDATGYLNENLGTLNSENQSYKWGVGTPVAIGDYSYNNYAILGGIGRNFTIADPISFGARLLMGQYFANIPAVIGKGDTSENRTGNNVNVSLPAIKSGRNFGFDLGIRLGVRLMPCLYLLLNIDYVFATPPTGSNSIPHTSTTAMFNSTLGIQFEL